MVIGSLNPIKGDYVSKIRIRFTANSMDDAIRIRNHMLKKHPQMILKKPFTYTGSKQTTFLIFGDYEFNKVRRRSTK